MADQISGNTPIPEGYVQLTGSERRPSANAKLLGPADNNERFEVIISLRRRTDGEPLPDYEYFRSTAPHGRPRLSSDDFAKKYGASDEDLKKVVAFATSQDLTVGEAQPARRQVMVSGTVEQMSKAFGVTLSRYEHTLPKSKHGQALVETYRGRDGFIHVPANLADIITGVFGLDNRSLTKRNSGDPPNTSPLTVPQIAGLYNFPTNSAAGQTIAILSADGYQTADLQKYFMNLGLSLPTITDISVDASNTGNGDPETTQDICIAASAAPGAAIAVYFTTGSQSGWVNLLGRVAHPNLGDPTCDVLSSSFYLSNGDDSATIISDGLTTSAIQAISAAFQDAAIQGVTVCIASGDTGTDSKVGDGKAHVQYPASDPWVLSVGGTTVGNVNGSSFVEYVWNDTTTVMGFNGTGATGGGVSDFFLLPSYQTGAGVPRSLNDGTHVGRGVPDVAANASVNSGYPIPLATAGSLGIPNPFPGDGTSASAPLWAGLIAVVNAGLGANLGFVNPALYAAGSTGFHDILGAPGPADNGLNGVSGYPAGPGWDACTGWGSPNGTALMNAFLTTVGLVSHSDGVLTVMDTPASAQRPYAFVRGTDGNLWVDWWTGSQWIWANQSKPAGVSISGPEGALTVMDTPTSPQRPYAFVQGNDGNLWVNWWTGSQWIWANQAKPPGVNIAGLDSIITVMDTPASPQRPYAFVVGTDNNLWVNWWTGSQWIWANQGKPSGVNIAGPEGALTVMDTPTSPQRPYAFVQGNDGNLWVNWWTGSQWIWANQAKPPEVDITGRVGVITVMDSRTSPQRPYAFVQGSDGNLWVNWWTGSQWIWANQGKPSGVNVGGRIGVITVMDSPTSPQRPYVFVQGSDGNLWVNWWTGSQWIWANQGKPTGVDITATVGVITVMDSPTSPQRPYTFVQASDGNLWVNWWNGSQWSWSNQGHP